MISGLLITIDIFVSIALVIVVLMQRSEGGAFGMGGGPTGLVTARGAGDLLTRTTWVLFTVFLVVSLGLSLLGAHDRSQSSVLDRLKLQQINPSMLSRPVAPPPAAPAGPPTEAPAPSAGLLAPPPASMSAPATSAPLTVAAGAPVPAPAAKARRVRHAAAAAPVSLEGAAPTEAPATAPAAAAPPTVAPPPKADTPSPGAPAAPATQP